MPRHRRSSSDHDYPHVLSGPASRLTSSPPPPPSSNASALTMTTMSSPVFFSQSPEMQERGKPSRSGDVPEPFRPSCNESTGSLMDYSDTSNEQAKSTRRSKRDHFRSNSSSRRTMRLGSLDDLESHGSSSHSASPHGLGFHHWMTQLAYSFRSPPDSLSHKRISQHHSFHHSTRDHEYAHDHHHHHHHHHDQRTNSSRHGRKYYSSSVESFESTPLIKDRRTSTTGNTLTTASAHMDTSTATQIVLGKMDERRIRIAAAFLCDYEATRSPTLQSSQPQDISEWQLQLYELKYSAFYTALLWMAVLLLFASSFLEHVHTGTTGNGLKNYMATTLTNVNYNKVLSSRNAILMTLFNVLALTMLIVDICMMKNVQRAGRKQLLRRIGSSSLRFSTNRDNTLRNPKLQPAIKYHFFNDDHKHVLMSSSYPSDSHKWRNESFTSRSVGGEVVGREGVHSNLIKLLVLFIVFLAVENLSRLAVSISDTLSDDNGEHDRIEKEAIDTFIAASGTVLISSVFKPLVLFYISAQGRNALEALRRILIVVTRVIIMELLLILMFAAIGCRLFAHYPQFDNLSTAWLSLFQLSTTVVNPSLWMPMYRDNPASAAFFIFFVIVCAFYLHRLVLSVVFSTYIYAVKDIHVRSSAVREECLLQAYLALTADNLKHHGKEGEDEFPGKTFPYASEAPASEGFQLVLLRPLLQRVRPHYNAAKISALLEMMEPAIATSTDGNRGGLMDFPTFRRKIRKALNASIRTPRAATNVALALELFAAVVAIMNFVYVILEISKFKDPRIEDFSKLKVGCVITLLASVELLLRFNPLHIAGLVPLNRLNTTFDGLALSASLISIVGIILLPHQSHWASQLILTGRAIDMIRVMRFFHIFREVVRRSVDVFPALAGPLILVVSTLHVFVYVGMALWGGAIQVGKLYSVAEIEPLYDLNNFNSYQEGVVTMFQVLAVNDWHAIAKVFLYADRCSNPWIVHSFCVLGNVILVSIMLNVVTAFFVEAFVRKIVDDPDEMASAAFVAEDGINADDIGSNRNLIQVPAPSSSSSAVVRRDSDVQRVNSHTSSMVESGRGGPNNSRFASETGAEEEADGYSSDGSGGSEYFYEFDVYEREGLDKIMQTVAGVGTGSNHGLPWLNSNSELLARQLCDYFEIFHSLICLDQRSESQVGFLVCDQLTMERFGNKQFQNVSVGFLEASDLHAIVSDMHAELLALPSRVHDEDDRSLIRTYPRTKQVLEITASLLRQNPALSLFVTRVRRTNDDE